MPTIGCGRIVGADEYEFAGPGSPEDEPPTVANPCQRDEVVTYNGGCQPVGVRPEMCDGLIEFDPHPEGGCRPVLPETECEKGAFGLGTEQCGEPVDLCEADHFAPVIPSDGHTLYVDAAAPEGGKGTKLEPLRSIADALTQHPGDALYLLVRGTFREDVAIARPKVTIRGCLGWALIEGQQSVQLEKQPSGAREPCFRPGTERFGSYRRAALCIAPGVQDVTLQGLDITGPGDGVQIWGATGVTLNYVRIRQTGAYGLRIGEARTDSIVASNVELDRVSIYQAHGAGISVVGSTVSMDQSGIQQTLPINDWEDDQLRKNSPETSRVPEHYRVGWARGITIHPGEWSSDKTHPDPEDFRQSVATVSDTVITGNKEMAVFAAGAKVRLERVFLGGLARGTASGRGIVAERSQSSGVPAEVNVFDSVIERTADAAVDVRDARVTLERTTIRDTWGRAGDGCSGQAIRARSLPLSSEDYVRARIEATDSTIIGARQAGIFAASSSVKLTNVLIRNIAPDGTEGACAAAMGDGVALETFSGQKPADAVLDQVRVEGAARAALLTTGPDLELHSTLLEACSGRGLVDATGRGRVERVDGAVCGCEKTWSRCERVVEPLPSWVLAGPTPVWPGSGDEVELCAAERGEETTRPLSGGDLIHPEAALAAGGTNGCLLGALAPPGEITATYGWRPGYLTGMFPPWIPYRGQLLTGGATPLSIITFNVDFPITGSVFFVQFLPAGTRLRVTPDAPIVDLVGNPLPDGRVPAGSTNIFGTLVSVPVREPGWYTFEAELPEGFSCRSSPMSQLGSETHATARFARAEWGIYALVGFEDCAKESP